MKESVSDILINLAFSIGIIFVIFIIMCGVTSCIIMYYNRIDNNNNNNNEDLVIVTTNFDLRMIPIVAFSFKDFKNDVECVVCLSDLIEGDKARVLPSCNHLFHADCIESWIRFHFTCPICRKRVFPTQLRTRPGLGGGDETLNQNHDMRSENREFPTYPPRNTETVAVEDVSCGGENEGPPELTAVVIDIPAKEIGGISDNI